MTKIFADRIQNVPKSFIREILKVANDPNIISFAGGLPNCDFFAIKELQKAANEVFINEGKRALQYSSTEGDVELRTWISRRYKTKQKLNIPIKNILITSGSQQGLDLIAKVLLNEGDKVVIEEPGYLGAIQAFSIYKPQFKTVPLLKDGPDIIKLNKVLKSAKFMYSVSNFQNPSGATYSERKRFEIANILTKTKTLLIEDDPYGELKFIKQSLTSFKKLLPKQTILLGSFSKTVVPAFRIGWIVAEDHIIEKLIIAKQAADLHTNYFSQRVLSRYLQENDLDKHIAKIKQAYNLQRLAMIKSIKKYFPSNITFTEPAGGMFLWVTLPKNISAMKLFELAIKQNVAFVPGDSFYINKSNINTLRLNFSCVNPKTIEIGIKRLADTIKAM